MNKTGMRITMGLCALIAGAATLVSPLRAEEKMGDMKMGNKEAAKPGKMKMPQTVEGIWEAINKEHAELDGVVKGRKLDRVHLHAFAIRDLAKGLTSKAPADKKAAVKAALKKIAMLAAELDKSGDAADQVATEVNLKKFDAAIGDLEAQFKKKTG